jgi:hypothetical protein
MTRWRRSRAITRRGGGCTQYRPFADTCTEYFGGDADGSVELAEDYVEFWMDVLTGVIDLDSESPPLPEPIDQ